MFIKAKIMEDRITYLNLDKVKYVEHEEILSAIEHPEIHGRSVW